jgi:hypothetical protein
MPTIIRKKSNKQVMGMFIHLQGSHKKLEEKGSGWVCTIFALKCEPYTHCGEFGILHLAI